MLAADGVAGHAHAGLADLTRGWRESLAAERARLARLFQDGAPVNRLLQGLSQLTDRYVRIAAEHTGVARFATLVAVGGYGRGELFPYSDVDSDPRAARARPTRPSRRARRALVQLLLGPRAGDRPQPCAPSPECGQRGRRRRHGHDLAARGAAHLRPRAGCSRPSATCCSDVLDPRAFLRAKLLEHAAAPHQVRGHALRARAQLQGKPGRPARPAGPALGGARRRPRRATGRSWRATACSPPPSAARSAAPQRILKQIRARLHIVARPARGPAGVRPAARRWPRPSASRAATDQPRASEVLMQTLLPGRQDRRRSSIRWSCSASSSACIRTRPARRPAIDGRSARAPSMLDIVDDRVLRARAQRDPASLPGAAAAHRAQGHDGAAAARASGTRAAAWTRPSAARSGEPRPFLAILQQRDGVLHTLRLMNQWTVLGRYLPVFRRIVGQMQHDLFHVYTVDQHILMVVRNLRRFAMPANSRTNTRSAPADGRLRPALAAATWPRSSTTSPRAAAATTRTLGGGRGAPLLPRPRRRARPTPTWWPSWSSST